MKKVDSIPLIILILIANLGLAQGDHYCEGQIVSHFLIPHMPDECEDMMDDHSCENIILDRWITDSFEQSIFNFKNFECGQVWRTEVVCQFDQYEEKLYSEEVIIRELEFPDIFLWNMSFLI